MSKLALLGGAPLRTHPYPDWPVFDQSDIEAVTQVVRSGRWSSYPYPGPQTKRFLEKFTELQGGGFPVAMCNGSVTMEVALRVADIGWGDEVIVPALTFAATATAPMQAGAVPVLVDIDPETYCMDVTKIESAITPQTRAILPVHLGAQMADMDAIMDIARRHNLIVIEDSAHAHGSRWRNQGAGTIGHFGSFSFQSSKVLATGEGGVLLCQNQEHQARAESLINCGRPYEWQGERRFTLGCNYRMTEFQAALGVVALERFPQQLANRAEMADYLEQKIGVLPGVRLLKRDPRHTVRSFYMYGFAIAPEVFLASKAVICKALAAEGIPAKPGYPPMHRYNLFQPRLSRLPAACAFSNRFDLDKMSFPAAERAAYQESIWLDEKVFRSGKAGVEDVARALAKLLENTSALAGYIE